METSLAIPVYHCWCFICWWLLRFGRIPSQTVYRGIIMAQREVWQKPVTDNEGNTITGASVTVFEQDGTTLATIYTSLTGGVKANPFLTSTDGLARFYADPGRYVVRAQKGAFTAENIDVDLSMKALREDLSTGVAEIAGGSAANLRGAVNVADFGAVGDGVTDDAHAFISALSEHDHIFVKDTGNEYIIDERIILSSGQRVTGVGMPTLKLKGKNWGNTNDFPAAIFVFPESCVGATAEYFRLDGNRGNHTANNLTNVECVECDGFQNIVQYCEIFNSQADGIDSDGNLDNPSRQGNWFIYNKIYNCNGYGVHNSIGSFGNYVIGNDVENCGFALSRGGIESLDFPGTIFRSFGEHIIVGNKARNCFRNFDIRGDNPSVFTGNISLNGSNPDILTRADAVLNSGDAILGQNVNNLRKAGFYKLSSVGQTNGPSGEVGGGLLVMESDNNRFIQLFAQPTSFGSIFNRLWFRTFDGTNFSDWDVLSLTGQSVQSGGDVNNNLRNGIYGVSSGAANLPQPAGSAILIAETKQEGRVVQLAMQPTIDDNANSARMWLRGYDGSAFGAWSRVITSNIGAGGIGATAIMSKTSPGSADVQATVAGSELRYSNTSGQNLGATPSGTWEAQGQSGGSGANLEDRQTLWRRIA